MNLQLKSLLSITVAIVAITGELSPVSCLSVVLGFSFRQGESQVPDRSLEQGRQFLKSRLPEWRAYGQRPNWFKYHSETKDRAILLHFAPKFYLEKSTFSNGHETVFISNNRYSARIEKKNPGSSEYELVNIGAPVESEKAYLRRFDPFAYTLERDYIPDLVENQVLEVSGFEQVENVTTVWLTYSDSERSGFAKQLKLRGNFQLTFGELPYPLSAIFTSGERYRYPQIHRMRFDEFISVGGCPLPVYMSCVSEQYDENGSLRRTMTICPPREAGARETVTEEELDSRHCFLEFYGLDEPGFSEIPAQSSSSFWMGSVLVIILVMGGVYCFRKRSG